jgi:uncharacterized cupin superfamily protein
MLIGGQLSARQVSVSTQASRAQEAAFCGVWSLKDQSRGKFRMFAKWFEMLQ